MTSQDAESFFSDVQSLPADNDIFSMLTCIYKSQQGFSELWKARHKGKWVVLKCVRKEYVSSVLAKEMLAKEYQTGYPLQHPNIVTMLDFTQVPPLGDCIVEEYVDGMTLAEFIRKGQAADSDIKRILMQTVGAVGYLHQRQLIHHDLKPANIIITHNGGNVKLIDFGLSRTDDDASPQPVAGTVHYVATEMMEGKQSDCRADIYSLGVIIQDLVPLCSKSFGKRLQRIARRCIATLPDDRYQHADDLLDDLSKSQDHAGKRLWPWLAIAFAACLVFVIAGKPWASSNAPSTPKKDAEEMTTKVQSRSDIAPEEKGSPRQQDAPRPLTTTQPTTESKAKKEKAETEEASRPEVYVDKTDTRVRRLHDYTVAVTRRALAAYGDITPQTLDSINTEIDRVAGKGTPDNIKLRLTMQAVVNQMVSRRR